MHRFTLATGLLLVALAVATPVLAVPGATDRVPAASLLVPFFETGIDIGTNPHDTLLVVTNWLFGNQTFHYHVWDVDGNATALSGNITLGSLATWDVSMRDLLNVASPAVRAQLTEGAFFRGFVTIDTVTAATILTPRDAAFPFSDTNSLEGFIYYVRLLQGSANGLAMVPLEAVPETTNSFVRGFYSNADRREEIDPTGRRCAQRLATGSGDCASGIDGPLERVHMRIFRSPAIGGSSRGIVFTWRPGFVGGPSTFCDVPANSCSPTMTYRQYDQSGAIVVDSTIRLDHVVNIIENSSLVGSESGWISILNIPNVQLDLQVYGLSFNSAAPPDNPLLTWDAIFEAYIVFQ